MMHITETTKYNEIDREYAKVPTMTDAKRIAYSRGYILGQTINKETRESPAFTFLVDPNGIEVGFIQHPGSCEAMYQYFAKIG